MWIKHKHTWKRGADVVCLITELINIPFEETKKQVHNFDGN